MGLTDSQLNGRFRLLDRPAAYPHKCSICGSVERPVVDFGLSVDYYGAVVFCTECLKSAAVSIGMVDGREHENLLLKQRYHEQQMMQIGAFIGEYATRFNRLHAEYVDNLSNFHNVNPYEKPKVDSIATPDDTSRYIPTPTEELESVSESGRISISAGSDDGSKLFSF